MTIIKKDVLSNLSLSPGVDGFLMYSASNSTLLPPWWSEMREIKLRIASIENDMLSSVIQTMVMKLFTLPLRVVPKNQYIQTSVQLANTYNTILQTSWNSEAERFLNDVVTFDKGGFLLILGNDNISRPFSEGEVPTGLKHIPAQCIELIDNTETPYRYIGANGGSNIGIHWSRVIRLTQIPTAISEKSYVGLSFVSRAFNVAQLMMSSIQYGLEGLGKIDSDQVIWGTSVTSQAIKQAFKDAKIDSLNSGLRTNGARVFLGLRDPQAKVNVLDLKRLPANFSYETFLAVTVKLLAIAAGIDEDDIVATSSAGTTKTATLISDLKSRFKLVSWFTNKIETELNQKFLPHNLIMQIGETSGEINESEAKTRINIARTDELLNRTGTLTVRAARQNAVMHGFITQSQFVSMELEDGRLENGLPIYTLFFSNNEMVKNMLNVGLTNPFDIETMLDQAMIIRTQNKLIEVDTIATNTTSDNIFQTAKQCRAALEWILSHKNEEEITEEPTEEDNQDQTEEDAEPITKKSYPRPTSKIARERQTKLRGIIKDVWSSKTDTTKLTTNDILKLLDDDYLKVAIQSRYQEFETFLYYIETHTQNTGTKLTEIYSKLDNIIPWN
jgi:hypothetical protein